MKAVIIQEERWRYWLRVAIVILPASFLAATGWVGEKIHTMSNGAMDKLQAWDGPLAKLRK